MTDSSSSSDEEEKAKLKSAAWPISSSVYSPKGQISENKKTRPKQSLRNSEVLDDQTDYRNIDATPELKAFITKKLTSWLDSSISVIDRQVSGTQTSKATLDDADDDFQLFSTSKPGLSIEQPLPQKRKQRPQLSSSDSDSEEERSKLASVAVSYNQILLDSQPSTSQDHQVTSNLSPTNSPSALTSADPSVPSSSCPEGDLKSKTQKCSHGDNGDAVDGDSCHGDRKSKKKKKKKQRILDCEDMETLTEAHLPIVNQKNQTKKQTLEKLPTNQENGNASSPYQFKETFKKRRKKKSKADRDLSCQMKRNNPETSTR